MNAELAKGKEIELKRAEGERGVKIAVGRELKMVELEKGEEKKRLLAVDAIINAMPDGLIVLDLNGVILSYNSAMVKMIGYTSEERIGKSFFELRDSIKAEDIERFVKLLGELIETGHVEPIEIVLITKDGRKIPIIVTYSLIKDAEGNPKNVIAVLRDITELKRAEWERGKADKERIEELEKFTKIAVGRELKMVELKERIEELESKLKEITGKE